MTAILQAERGGNGFRQASLAGAGSGDRPLARPDFSPVPPAAPSDAPPAEARLELPFRPPIEDLVSFLVNGLCLIGRHRILEWDARDGRAAAALESLGHRVTALQPVPGTVPHEPQPGAYDRAMLISRAFGYLGDEAGRLWLRAARRALQPGGLLLFHVLDRDRAWSLVRDFLAGPAGPAGMEAGERAGGRRAGAGADIGFDPRSGRVTARIRCGEGAPGGRPQGPGRAVSVRAFNLGEIRGLLAETGFRLEQAYGDWRGGALEEAGERTGRILVVASKSRRTGGKGRPRTGPVSGGGGGA